MAKKDKKESKVKEAGNLDDVFKVLEQKYGSGVIMLLGKSKIEPIDVISTGSLMLDNALGIGGLPRGRVVELYGAEGGGKTTLALQVIAQAQKLGGEVAFVDAEHSLDLNLASSVGVNVETLCVSQPDYGEQALEIVELLVSSGKLSVVVVDSVAALTPKAEIDGDMDDVQMGAQARMMGKALRKINGKVSKTNTLVIFINQLRSKIGTMGDPDVTPGGRALKFYASVRLDIRRIAALKQGENVIGNRTKITVKKNKLAPPFKVVETDLIFGKGINRVGEVIDLACDKDLFDRTGSWFSYNGERLAQGKQQLCDLLNTKPELLKEIEDKITGIIDVPKVVNDENQQNV